MIDVYLQDEIKIKTSTTDQWGEPSESSTETVSGRFVYKTQIVRDAEGQEVTASGHVLLKDRTLGYDATIEYDNTDYAIANIHRIRDFDNKYLKVFLK